MKTTITTIMTILIVTSASLAYAEVPTWIKTSAGWWADGEIPESEFLAGISFLINNDIIDVPPTIQSEISNTVPSWVKDTAGWWADDIISDQEFVSGIQHLVSLGIITVATSDTSANAPVIDSEMDSLQAQLEECAKITKAYKRIDCEKPVKQAITSYQYKQDSEKFVLGPITYYWKGLGSEGNTFETSPTGQALLSIRMLAENTSSEIVALNCTSPSICSYDIWDGSQSFKYAGMDFTSGQIVINPGDSREFNILFGPNIGYGGTEFVYDSSKAYTFRINEDFGSANISLPLE